MLTPPEVRAVYVVDADGALTGVLTRKTLVAKVVAAGLDPSDDGDRRARRGAVLHDRCRHAARRGLPLPRGARRRARAGRRARPPRRRALAQRVAAAPRRGRGARQPGRGVSAIDVARARRRDARLRGRRPPEQRRRGADARRRAADGDRAPRAGGADRRLRGRGPRGRAGRGGLRLRRAPARLLARRGRDRRERDARLGHGVLLRSTSSRATGSSPAAPSTRRTTSRCSRWRSAPAPSSSWSADDESGQVSLRGARGRSSRAARGSSRSSTFPRRAGSCSRPPRWGGCVARRACRCCSTRASRSGQLPTDVGELECDILSATGRKFLRGPRGTGFLYVRQELIERARAAVPRSPRGRVDDGARRFAIRADARRFENWETSYATKLGLGAAVDYALGWGLDGDRRARAGARGVAAGAARRRCRASRCTTAGSRSAGSSRSRSTGAPAQEIAARLGGGGRQRLGHAGVLQPARSRGARARRGRARVRALLQHRRGAGAARRGRGRDGGMSAAAEPGADLPPVPAPLARLGRVAVLADERAGTARMLVVRTPSTASDRSRRGAEPQGAKPAPRIRGRRSSSTTRARASRSAARRSTAGPSW